MPNKGKKLFPIYRNATLFGFCILSIIVISNIIYLLDISRYCPPLLDDNGPLKNMDAENPPSSNFERLDNQTQDIVAVNRPIKVSIGTVICHEQDDLSPREEALVLLKSTIISAFLYQTFPINIEFHLFLEDENDKEYFLQNIQPFTGSQYDIQVVTHFYSVFDIVPKNYQNLLFGSNLRCTYVRIFFPFALPQIDSILYLDTDVIITGNLAEIWNNFYKMGKFGLVGAVMDIEPENLPWFNMYSGAFLNTPVPTPRGLNAGVLLMNLTRMRNYEFSDKIMRLYQDYSIYKNDQTLLNTLLFYNPYLLYVLPCQYNFRPTACSLGFYCKAAINDPTGIQIMHQYQKKDILGKENAFRDIAEAYQNITERGVDFRTSLIIKVRTMYANGFRSVFDHGKCNGILDKFLFRKFFP